MTKEWIGDPVYDSSQPISLFNMPPGGPLSLSWKEVQELEESWL